jgi:hypothetical protein
VGPVQSPVWCCDRGIHTLNKDRSRNLCNSSRAIRLLSGVTPFSASQRGSDSRAKPVSLDPLGACAIAACGIAKGSAT